MTPRMGPEGSCVPPPDVLVPDRAEAVGAADTLRATELPGSRRSSDTHVLVPSPEFLSGSIMKTILHPQLPLCYSLCAGRCWKVRQRHPFWAQL